MHAGRWGQVAAVGLWMLAGCGSTGDDEPEPTGCTTAGALLTGDRQFWGAAADEHFLYVGDSGGRMNRIRLADKRVEPLAELGTDQIVYDCAIDGSTLYMLASRRQIPETGGGGRLLSIPIAGGSVTELATALDLPSSLVLDSTHLYWVTVGTQGATGGVRTDGRLQRRAKSGGGVETLLSGISAPVDLALDSANVFVAATGSGSTPGPTGVLRVPRTGGLFTVASSLPAFKLVLSGNFAFFSTRAMGGAIVRLDKTAGGTSALASGLPSPSSLLLSGSTLYFVADSDGSGSVRAVDVNGGTSRLVADALNAPAALTLTGCGVVASMDREVRLLPGS